MAQVLSLSLDLAAHLEVEPETPQPPEQAARRHWRSRVGAQVTLESGLGRAVLPGGALFIELEPSSSWNARLLLRGAYGERDAAFAVSIGLLASRLEACWSRELTANLAAAPCVGAEVGLVFADSSASVGRSDAGPWSSAVGHVRVRWQLAEIVALESQVGLIVPLVQYSLTAQTGGEVTGSAFLGLEAALGFSFRL